MSSRMTATNTLTHFLHSRLLSLLLGTYAVASLFPRLGMRLKDARPLWLLGDDPQATPALPALLLAFLLFHAGLRVRGDRFWAIPTGISC